MQKTLTILQFEKMLTELDKNIVALQKSATDRGQNFEGEVSELQTTRVRLLEGMYSQLSAWDQVEIARHENRPYTLDYIRLICDDFYELHGDRHIADDAAIVGGPAIIGGVRVMLVGQQKGRDIATRQLRNFGYSRPAGYRKALRLMKMAEKLRMPVVTLVDTPGADTQRDSEEQAISEAIALNLWEMSVLRTPIVCGVIGEGGSGGALGIAVADRVLMLEHAIYSVIAPEGCAAILDTFGRDKNRKAEAAAALHLTASDAQKLGLIDEILPEPLGSAHGDPETTAETLKSALLRNLVELSAVPLETLLEQRYQKYRGMGKFDRAEPGDLS